jgi:ribosomal protein L13
MVYNCDKKGHYSTDCCAAKKNGNEESNMVSKADFKNIFQSSLKVMISKKEKQKNDKTNMELYDESLGMNVFDKLMEGKHNEIVSKNDDDSIIIVNTSNLFHFGQTNTPDKSYIKKNKKIIMMKWLTHVVKIIKLKNEPEAAPENKPVQYTADIIVEIKNRDGAVVPMRDLLDTGSTSTIISR